MSRIEQLDFPTYLALDAWGSSSLKAMRQGPPARVLWEKENRKESSDAMRLGSAVHSLFLTPNLFEKSYVTKPEGLSFTTKKGKAWRRNVADGVTILTFDEGETVNAIDNAMRAKAIVSDTVERAEHIESSFIWTCPESGELCKGRPDWVDLKSRAIYDLKVSRHAQGKSLAYRAYVEGWMHQLAFYRTGALSCGLEVDRGRLVVVTPTAPHFVYTLDVKIDTLDLLELENIGTLKAMRECRESGVWPDTADEWVKVEAPAAALIEFGEASFDATAKEEGQDNGW